MKYIKTFENIISNSSDGAINHPLYELSKHLENILKEIKIIDNFQKGITRLYFSEKQTYMSITLSYYCDGYRLVEMELVKFHDMENVGLRVGLIEYYTPKIENMRYISGEFLNTFKEKLKKYYTRTNKDTMRFDFNIKDLNDIIEKLNTNEIVEELELKKSTSKFNI